MKLNVIIFGSSGMIRQAILQECIESTDVEKILVINRKSIGIQHPKITEIITNDITQFTLPANATEYNVCMYSLGVSVVGLNEQQYHHIIYEIGVAIAEKLLKEIPNLCFCYVSGTATDSTEKGRVMWARVKGKFENKLLSMPFRAAYMFRPGYVQPLKGVKSKTGWYNAVYVVAKPIYFLLKPLKSLVTDSVTLSQAMLRAAANGYSKNILENRDINSLGRD